MRTDSPFGTPETKEQIEETLASIEAVLEKKERDERIFEESHALTLDFGAFIRASWPQIEPLNLYMHNWHIDAIVEHLMAVSMNQIKRLQIWVPPGSMKSLAVSVLWPAWEWTHDPALRYWTGSYDIRLSQQFAAASRNLMLSDWYQERWGLMFKLMKKHEAWITNDQGGHRLATSPESSGTGVHGHRILLDDALNALDASATTRAILDRTNTWYSESLATRGLPGYAEVIIMQRLHESDVAAHALSFADNWEVLCLPEVYEKKHPFAWKGDPRKEGELMWPERRDVAEHKTLVRKLGKSKAAGQLQQRPAAREGTIIPRSDWRFFPPAFLDAAEGGDVSKLPRFRSIVISWDTTFKDKSTSDYVAGGVWGINGADRYLLRVFHQRASLSVTKRAMIEMRQWCARRWPTIPTRILIEKSANGVEIINQLKREIPGVIPYVASNDKITRAEACEPDFNSHNVFVPGVQRADMTDYDSQGTPAWVQELIEQCSSFPLSAHDDLVDMVTMALNYARTKSHSGMRTSSALRGISRPVIPARR